MLIAARGTDDALYIIMTTDGVHWSDGLGHPGAYQDLGGILTDSPVVFRRGAYLTAVVTGTDGKRDQRYTNDGVNFAQWSPFDGAALPLGANIIGDQKDWATYQLPALEAMDAQVVRVSMFYDLSGPGAAHYTGDQLTQIVQNTGVRTIIIRGCESHIYPNDTQTSLNASVSPGVTLLQYMQSHPEVLFFFELGNEPDQTATWANDPFGARYTALDTLDQIANGQGYRASLPNLRWMISQPTAQHQSYFDSFNSDPDGRGKIGARFDAMAAHCYSFSYLDRNTQNNYGTGTALATVDWCKAVAPNPIYVTEAGININWQGTPTEWQDTCGRYVSSLASFDGPYGQVRGVMFFCVNDNNPEFYSPQEFYSIDVQQNGQFNPGLEGSHVLGARN